MQERLGVVPEERELQELLFAGRETLVSLADLVEVGEAVAPGQTLCILEAMKLMNEVKSEAEALVRAVHVDNASAVEFGQLLFELEPLNGRPLDAV